MSELKAIESSTAVIGNVHLVYDKSEADKVIADLEESHKKEVGQLLIEITELEKRIADGDKDFEMANHQNERLLKIISHQKYRRCLAMARIAQDDWHLHNSFYAMGHQEFEKRKCEFYEKWRNRWLAIAEKFKTNSTLQQKD